MYETNEIFSVGGIEWYKTMRGLIKGYPVLTEFIWFLLSKRNPIPLSIP
jgi:hypothetical protein